MNTYIEYLYRDGENNKVQTRIVLPGELTLEEIKPFLDMGMYFIPYQVGLEDLQGNFQHGAALNADYDHPWHEMETVELTEVLPTVEMTAEELLARFASVEWNAQAAMVKLGLAETEDNDSGIRLYRDEWGEEVTAMTDPKLPTPEQTLAAILVAADEGYPDLATTDYNQAKAHASGDALSDFIVVELTEVNEGKTNPYEMWATAISKMEAARDQLDNVIASLLRQAPEFFMRHQSPVDGWRARGEGDD